MQVFLDLNATDLRVTPSHEGRGVGIRCVTTASPLPLWERASCRDLARAKACASRMAGRVRGETYPRVPRLKYTSPTSSVEGGAIMRRRASGTGCGVPAGPVTQTGARGGVGLPPGPLRGPARSWLTTVGSIPNAGDRRSTAFSRGEAEPQRDKGSRRDTYGESGAGAWITLQISMR
jgi:hypothetical protein